MKLIYTATSDPHPDEKDQRVHKWVSLDGEYWLEYELDDPMTAERYDEVAGHFAGTSTATRRTFPLTVATAYLRRWCPRFTIHAPIEVPDHG